jgi:CheY-like chemotaxis protein
MSITNELLPNSEFLKELQILVVDNDRDSRELYTVLLESYGAKVITISSIKDALDLLKWCIPAILICEIRFLGESVYPLIQQVRYLAFTSGRTIPILATSTCSLTSLTQQFQVKVEAYLLKPFDLDYFVAQVWKLTQCC